MVAVHLAEEVEAAVGTSFLMIRVLQRLSLVSYAKNAVRHSQTDGCDTWIANRRARGRPVSIITHMCTVLC